MQLLWLLVRFRIEFKFFFNILYGLAPSYLSYLISRWRPSRYNLRNSKDNLLLTYPSFISKLTLGDRSFTLCTKANIALLQKDLLANRLKRNKNS